MPVDESNRYPCRRCPKCAIFDHATAPIRTNGAQREAPAEQLVHICRDGTETQRGVRECSPSMPGRARLRSVEPISDGANYLDGENCPEYVQSSIQICRDWRLPAGTGDATGSFDENSGGF